MRIEAQPHEKIINHRNYVSKKRIREASDGANSIDKKITILKCDTIWWWWEWNTICLLRVYFDSTSTALMLRRSGEFEDDRYREVEASACSCVGERSSAVSQQWNQTKIQKISHKPSTDNSSWGVWAHSKLTFLIYVTGKWENLLPIGHMQSSRFYRMIPVRILLSSTCSPTMTRVSPW